MVLTREAPSAVEKTLTKDEVLRLIVRYHFQLQDLSLFNRLPLRGEYKWALVLGAIGERGGGKSGSCAVIAMVDHMVLGYPVYSNMTISCDVEVDDDIAREHDLNTGGVVHYESLPLDKNALLKMDDRYRRSCILIEEINVQYSNVRRFMTNTNVDFNEVCQQLRKLEASLLYNVIDEMFIDPQLRALTDVFIKTYDTAFDQDKLGLRPRGMDFHWKLYSMTGYLRGEQGRYIYTKKPDEATFHFSQWRGLYNDKIHQEKGIYSISTKDKNKMATSIDVQSSEEMVEEIGNTDWIRAKVLAWKAQGIKTIEPKDLSNMLGIKATQTIKDDLKVWGVAWDRYLQCFVVGAERQTSLV